MNDANTLQDAHALRVETQAKRKELSAQLPALAMRIFALQNLMRFTTVLYSVVCVIVMSLTTEGPEALCSADIIFSWER
jgi:hypothetical protein